MKYTITISGLGGELCVGSLPKEVHDYYKKKGLGESVFLDEDAPEEIQRHFHTDVGERADILQIFGPFFDTGSYLSVKDEDGEEVFVGALVEDGEEEEYELPGNYNKRLDLSDMDGDHEYAFMALDIQKGVFNDYVIETNDFDPEKFLIDFDHITDGLDYDLYFVTGVRYDGELLEPTEEHSTRGKSANFRVYDLNKGEVITDNDDE